MPTHTAREIDAQPDVWRRFAPDLAREAADIRAWIASRKPDAIWLSGAGTSAYIGETLSRGIRGPAPLLPLPTTDLVASPAWMQGHGHRLSVQFGRSGNSSETVGLIDLLDAHLPQADRLQFTCNDGSALATRTGPGPGETRVMVLPAATHDQGFAMTSSFTTMYLAALACMDADFDAASGLPALADAAEAVLPKLWASPPPRPDRAIFLGSAALTGIARESALKVLELTAGQTLTQWDSTLGFRHGPKAAVDDTTAVFVMIHPDPHTARYDRDLAEEVRRQFPEVPVTTIGAGCDIDLPLTGTAGDPALYVLPAQVMAHRWSEALGLPVDDPFAGRNLTRVVSGVTLYGWS